MPEARASDDHGGTTSPTGWRRALRVDVGPLRRSRQLRLLLTAQVVSLAGTMLTAVALPYQAYHLTHSSLVVGLVSLAEVLPYIAVGVLAGALADAVDRRRLAQASDAGLLLCLAALAANAALPHPRLWALFALTVAMGTLGALQRPALDALLPRVVAPDDIPATAALESVGSTAAMVAGPALAGVFIAVLTLSGVFALDAFSCLVSLAALGRMAPVPLPAGAERPNLARVAEGLRYAWSRQELMGTYTVDMAAMFFGMPEALFPQLATRFGGPAVLGLLFSAPAIGALLVSATAGWTHRVVRQGRALVFAATGWGVAVLGLGFAPDLGVAVAALIVAGAFDMVSGLMRSILWNQTIPDALRGRLAGIELVSFSSGPALGNLEAGVVETLTNLRTAIVSGGVACVAAAGLLAVLLPGLWRYEAPAGAAPLGGAPAGAAPAISGASAEAEPAPE